MSLTAETFQGCYVALITPMRSADGASLPEIDFDRYFEQVRSCLDAGVTGLLFSGTTGQSATLSHDEHVEVAIRGAQYAREYADSLGRSVQLLAGAGSNATHEACELSKRIVGQAPIDGLLHVTGYYNNPPQEGLRKHFEAIADTMHQQHIPIILYNVPGRTNSNLSADTVIQLAGHPGIIGIKEASGDLDQIRQIINNVDVSQFRVVSGEDHLVYEIMRMGGTGVVSATANQWPREFQVMTELGLAGEWDKAAGLQEALLPCCRAVFSVKNPIPLAHLFNTELRLPLVGLDELAPAAREKAEKLIRQALEIREFPHVETASAVQGE